MLTLMITIHVLASLVLILIVLIQGGKGAEMGAAFGGSSQTVFGSSGGATFFTKLTTGAAIVFMLSSIILAKYSAHLSNKSVVPTDISEVNALDKEPQKKDSEQTQPKP